MTTRQTPDAVREALVRRAIQIIVEERGREWATPKIIRAMMRFRDEAALDSCADHDRRIYEQGRRDACEDHDIALDSRAGDAGEGWQSIETAPRDGTWFIADGGGLDRPTPMKWCERVGAWEADAVMLEDWDNQAEGYSRPLFWFAIPYCLPATPAPAVDAVPAGEGLDWAAIGHDYARSALKGEWPGAQSPHYALSGAFTAMAKEIEQLRAALSHGEGRK